MDQTPTTEFLHFDQYVLPNENYESIVLSFLDYLRVGQITELRANDQNYIDFWNKVDSLSTKVLNLSLNIQERINAFETYISILPLFRTWDSVFLIESNGDFRSFLDLEELFIQKFGYLLTSMGELLPETERNSFREIIRIFEDTHLRLVPQYIPNTIDSEGASMRFYLYTKDEFSIKIEESTLKAQSFLQTQTQISVEIIEEFYKILTYNLIVKDLGRLRDGNSVDVRFGGKLGTRPQKIREELLEWCSLANELTNSVTTEAELLKGMITLYDKFINIHPFPDWNGKTRISLCLFIFKLWSKHQIDREK